MVQNHEQNVSTSKAEGHNEKVAKFHDEVEWTKNSTKEEGQKIEDVTQPTKKGDEKRTDTKYPSAELDETGPITILYSRLGSHNKSTVNLSSRLSYLFGTEEIVDMRRQLVLLRENLWNYQFREQAHVVCGGSLGEGVAYPRSDDDVMIYKTCHRVVRKFEDVSQEFDLMMALVKDSPGYCLLFDINGSYRGDLICYFNERPVVSSSLWKQKFLTLADGDFIHGPCSSFVIGSEDFDNAFCIPCSFWPDAARDWISRKRSHGWPSVEMIQNIERSKCHVVPVGNKGSPFEDHEWRISFLVAERMLMHSLNHAQFLTYNLLRIALKRKIEKHIPDILCSYYMKTTLFYTIENTSTEHWMMNNLEKCFQACLTMLYDNIKGMKVPNYFIPENNLVRHRLNHSNRDQLLHCIGTIREDGIIGVLRLSEEPQCLEEHFSLPIIESKLDREFLHSNHLSKVVARIQAEVNLNIPEIDASYTTAYCKNFAQLLKGDGRFTCKFSDILLHRLDVSCCLKLIHNLCSLPSQNEENEHVIDIVESLLQSSPKGDVTTGTLTLANCMYLVGKTESALYAIRKLLSEYPPYEIDSSLGELKRETYVDVMCSRGYSIDYKAKHAWAPYFYMPFHILNAFPSPMKILLSIGKHLHIHPITYALVLECLCHVRLKNRLELVKSTRCLIRHMKDLEGNYAIACAGLCVGIIRYVQGDMQSACRWFGSAYIMKATVSEPIRERLTRAVITYIACMINKHAE